MTEPEEEKVPIKGNSKLLYYIADVVIFGLPEAIMMRFHCKSRRKLIDEVVPRVFPAGLDVEAQQLVADFLEAKEERWLRLRSQGDHGLVVYPCMRIE